MYQEFFGLSRPPFKITPDTSLFFEGSQRGAALEALMYAINSGEGIIKVVGEVGSGKTMLCRMLEVRLSGNVDVIYIANPSLSPDNILQVIAHELHLDVKGETNKVTIMQQIQTYLLKKHADNRQVVLFVEEAQSMPIETLEEIRLLSNLETDENKLLQMVLFGQPELDEKLAQPHIRQLKERITHSFNLSPFAPEDTLQYLNFRLRAVGYKGPDIFNKKTAGVVKKYSDGLTRRINIIADKSLMAAYSEGSHTVTPSHIKSAALDSEFNKIGHKVSQNKNNLYLAGGFILVILALTSGYYMGSNHLGVLNQAETDLIKPASVKSERINNDPKKPDSVALQPLKQMPVTNAQQAAVSPAVSIQHPPVKNNNEQKKVTPDSITERLEITRQWLHETAGNHYSIQLFLARTIDADKVEAFLRDTPATLDFTRVYLYETVINGRAWYGVLYNDFDTRDKAIETLRTLPSSLKASDPYLRRISTLKKDQVKMTAATQ
jgi:type II secretory pathway predicted ATPase ExeA